jgi:opacity protein-like surface antigen
MCSTALTCNAHHTTDGKDNNFYVRFDAGISIPTNLNDKNDAYDFNSKKPGNSAIFNLGLGYIFNENFRSDVSLRLRNSYKYKSSFKDDDVESMNIEQKFKSTAIMLNGYYDIAHFSSFTPYVNLGLGYSRNNAADYKVTVINVGEKQPQNYIRAGKTSNNFAWNAGLGSLIYINDSISMDVSYKYSDLGKFSTTNIIRKNENRPESLAQPVSTKMRVHDITAGIIFKF